MVSELQRRRRNIRLTILFSVVMVALVMGGFMYKLTKPRVLNSQELREYGTMLLEKPRRFSDFELTDHRGQPVTRESLVGKWTLVFFGFTHCPDICPTTMATMGRMVAELKPEEQSDTQVLLITVDPERDTQEKLAKYAPYFNPDFVGVTGNPYMILKLATELGIVYNKVPLENGDYTVDHSGNVVIINPRGDYHGFFRPPLEAGSMRVAYRSLRETFNG